MAGISVQPCCCGTHPGLDCTAVCTTSTTPATIQATLPSGFGVGGAGTCSGADCALLNNATVTCTQFLGNPCVFIGHVTGSVCVFTIRIEFATGFGGQVFLQVLNVSDLLASWHKTGIGTGINCTPPPTPLTLDGAGTNTSCPPTVPAGNVTLA